MNRLLHAFHQLMTGNFVTKFKILVFDSTESNTSVQKEPCTIIEQVLGGEVVCRHYILEIMFCACNFLLGATSGSKGRFFFNVSENNCCHIKGFLF